MSSMEKIHFVKGGVLFDEGDKPKHALIIQAGSVELSKKTRNGFSKEISILGVGSIIGEVSLITNSNHSVTAKAIEDGFALILTRDDCLKRLKNSDHVLSLILKSVTKRLKTTY